VSDVAFSIGGTPAPFLTAMEQVKQSARDGASKVADAFGVEGLRGERAIRGRFLESFNDITKGGTNTAEAVGGAFASMAEGLKLSMGSMIALLAVSELVKGLYSGYQAAEKMKSSVKDALSINTDVTSQSVEQVQEDIKKLNADADANNLASMSSMAAGATVFVQALEEGKSISDVTREDAENYNRLKKEAHDMEDQEGAKAIDNANAVLELKVEGHDKEADALAHEQEMNEKILEAKAKGNQAQEDALNKQLELEGELATRQENEEQGKKFDKVHELEKQSSAEIDKQSQIGMTDSQKLDAAKAKVKQDEDALAQMPQAGADNALALAEKNLEYEKDKTAEKELQYAADKKNFELFQKGNEIDAEQKKKQDEATAKKLALLKEQQEAQQAVAAAGVDASLFHGEVSSLAKVGLGGRVSGANYGNQAQLKAVQDAAKHLADIKASMAKLSGAIGIAQ
jgi:hypothetical protein